MSQDGIADQRLGVPPRLARPAPKVLAIIVNYCTAEMTVDCLRSLAAVVHEVPGTQVVVTDNASPDGSGKVIAAAIESYGWGEWASADLLDKNGGFAFGINAGIRADTSGSFDYYWVLNSDTLFRPGALRCLLEFLENRPEVGIAGSCLEYPDGTQQISTFRFPTILGEIEANAPMGQLVRRRLANSVIAEPASRTLRACDWLAGASMLVRKQVIDEIGLFDEDYFLYYEETDFCRRAKTAGWECWFVPDSRVVHLIGASTGVTGVKPGPAKRRPAYWYAARRRYFLKNHGRAYAIAGDLGLALATVAKRLATTLRGKHSDVPERFLQDLARNSALLSTPISDRQHNDTRRIKGCAHDA